MQLPEISIRRPVFATVLSLLIVLIGWVSFQNLSVREYPKIDEPVVTVSTRLAGASSEVIESTVTKVLEDSLAGIEGVDVITSISRPEQSQISVRFRLERDPDAAAAEVRDKVARVRARLPQSVDEPVVAKVEADGRVTLAGRHGGYGNTVIIQHGNRYKTLYAHMHNFAKGIRNGSQVKQGQVIGYVGTTGLSTGPHLHYEFQVNGVHVDPLSQKLPMADPIAASEKQRFLQQSKPLMALLDQERNSMLALNRESR